MMSARRLLQSASAGVQMHVEQPSPPGHCYNSISSATRQTAVLQLNPAAIARGLSARRR